MRKYDKKYIKTNNYIYIFALFIFLVSTILSKTMWIHSSGETFELLLKVIRYISYFACILKILFDHFYFSYCWKIGVIAIFVLAISYFSASMIIFTYSLLFIASYGIDKKMIIKYAVCIQSCLLFIIIFASQIGLNIDYIFDAGERDRHGLGFTWTTTAAVFLFFISLEYIYIREKKMKMIEYMMLLILNYILYRLTNTRLTFYLSELALVFFWFLRNIRFVRVIMRKMRLIWIAMPFIITVFSCFIHYNYETGSWIWEKINDILSGRLALGKTALKNYGIKIFGQKIEWIGYGYQAKEGVYNYVDCSYLQILLQYGLVLLGICLIIYTYILLKSTQEGDYYLCGCVLIILVYSITEPFLLNLMFNPIPLLAAGYLGERKNREGITANGFT